MSLSLLFPSLFSFGLIMSRSLTFFFRSEICSADAEERAIVLGIMNAFGYAVNAWLPYLVFPAVDAPEFHKGFIFSSVMFVAQAGITWLVWFMHRREVRKKAMPVA
jgi:ACS family pantothenate transporter-like MFS transporter